MFPFILLYMFPHFVFYIHIFAGTLILDLFKIIGFCDVFFSMFEIFFEIILTSYLVIVQL